MLKRCWILFSAFCLMFLQLAVSSCLSSAHSDEYHDLKLTTQEKEWLLQHPVIKVSSELDYEPFDYIEGGVSKGYSIDYIRLMFDKLGIQIEFVQGSWEKVFNLGLQKDIDLMHSIYRTDDREKFFFFTPPYKRTVNGLFVRQDNETIFGMQDLSGKKIALVKGDFGNEVLESIASDAEYLFFDTYVDSLKAISMGVADVTVLDYSVGNFLTKKYHIHNIKTVEGAYLYPPKNQFGYCLAIRNDWPVFFSIIKKAMAAITPYELAKLDYKWFTVSSTYDISGLRLTSEEKKWLFDHPTIRVSSEVDYEPFDFIKNGVSKGYSVDYVELVTKKLGINIDYVQGTWDEVLSMGKEKKIDLMHTIFRTPEREKYFLFQEPYKKVVSGLFVRSTVDDIKKVADLSGRKVSLVKGDFCTELLKDMVPDADYAYYDEYADALSAIAVGEVEATVIDVSVGSYLIRKHTLSNIKPVSGAYLLPKDDLGYCLAVRDDWPVLYSILQKAVADVSAYDLAKLDQTWFPLSSKFKHEGLVLSSDEKKWLADHPVVRLGVDPDWTPIEFVDKDGNMQGLASEYVALIEQMLGIQFELVSGYNWSELLIEGQRGEVDLFSCLTSTVERRKYLNFTDPYLTLPIFLFARESTKYISDLSELRGKKVSVVEGYAVQEYLERDYPEMDLVLAENIDECIAKLHKREADAVVCSLFAGSQSVSRTGIYDVKVVGDTPYKYRLSMGVRKDWDVFVAILNNALKAISESERAKIFDKWVSVEYERELDYSLLWKSLMGVMVVVAFLLWSNWRLRSVVAEKTSDLVSALNEKNVLLRELYHRTKNNMQVISAMLISSMRNADDNVKNLFQDIINKIMAMTLVHQKLYESKDLSKISMRDYVEDLLENIEKSYRRDGLSVVMVKEVDDFEVNIDIGTTCGLLINELISNSFKHAFENRSSGRISINIRRKDNGEITLEVSDDGRGLPDGVDVTKAKSMGLRTIRTIVEHQLQGKVIFEKGAGLICRIKFNESVYSVRI